MQERLQKIISRAGFASRRAGEELILAGRVRVNGKIVTELGQKADPREDRIEVDGRRLTAPTPLYVVLHKPRNVVSTLSDPEGRPTVADYLRAAGARLYPVGRLDFATSGVLLATNDGEFANALLHPRGGVPKTYVIKVNGLMDEADLDRWRNGVRLDDGPTLPAEVRLLRHEEGKTWIEVTIREGRNQQLRRMGEATGFPVMRLARLSFAGVTSEDLRPGEWRPLTADELLEIRKQFGVPKRIRGAAKAAPPRPERGAPPRPERPRGPGAPRGEGPGARDERAGRRPEAPGRRDDRGARRPEGRDERDGATRRPERAPQAARPGGRGGRDEATRRPERAPQAARPGGRGERDEATRRPERAPQGARPPGPRRPPR